MARHRLGISFLRHELQCGSNEKSKKQRRIVRRWLIYLTDPARKGEFEPNFIDFEEQYEFTSIVICEMLQCYEDEEKALAMAAANSMPKTGDDNCQPCGSGTTHVMFPSTIVLQQTALPTFDGRYENWFKFKQMFRDIADKCTADSAATKLHYLDKALVGKAHGAIDQQMIRDNDYEGAWRSLTEIWWRI